MFRYPEKMEPHIEKAEGLLLYGLAVVEMDQKELVATIGWLLGQNEMLKKNQITPEQRVKLKDYDL